MTLALRYTALSHVGLLRDGNEDSGYAGPRLLAVADGMGGHAAGEVASAVAIASLAPLDDGATGTDPLSALRRAAFTANRHVADMVLGDSALDGMGTTLTSLLFTPPRLGLLHIGDSRGYLLRDGVLTQITHDDTLVQSLVDEGRISPEEASSHPQRNMILRAIDGRPDVDFDLSVREARAGDRYLLCSDGLTGVVGEQTLQEALSTPDLQASGERLVELALRGGGPDNITVIVADVIEGDGPVTPVVTGAAAEVPTPRQGGAEPVAPEDAAEPLSAQDPPRRRRGRYVLAGLLVLLLLAAGAGTGWAYVRSQWYVGVDGDQVSVYRGVSGSVAGIQLASVEQRTGLSTADLSELDRENVRGGIAADDPADADRIVALLRERAATGTPAASAAPGPTTASPSPSAAVSPSPRLSPTSTPTGTVP